MRRCRFKTFFYFKLWWPFCSAEQNHFSIFGKGSSKKYFCKIIMKSGHLSGRRCHLKVFFSILALVAIVSGNGTCFAVSVEGHPRNISMKLF